MLGSCNESTIISSQEWLINPFLSVSQRMSNSLIANNTKQNKRQISLAKKQRNESSEITQSVLVNACPREIWEGALIVDYYGFGRVRWGALKAYSRRLNNRENLKLVSPPDGDCALHSILQFCTFHHDTVEGENSLMQEIIAQWKVVSGGSTIKAPILFRILNRLRIPYYAEEVILDLAKSGKIVYKDLSGGCIVLKSIGTLGHVGFVTGKQMTKGRSLEELLQVLIDCSKGQLPDLSDKPVPNSEETMLKKRLNKEVGKRRVKQLTQEEQKRNLFYRDVRKSLAV